jgi:hypothetical protein
MGSVDTKPQMTVKWVRAVDGFACFGICIFLAVAIAQPFFLSSVIVTDIANPRYTDIVNGSTSVIPVNSDMCIDTTEPTVSPTCVCLVTAGQNETAADICLVEHHGLPGEQIKVGRINPNFLLFYVFIMSALYQLVLRNSMGVDLKGSLNRDVQIGVGFMCLIVTISCIMSIFQFDHGNDTYVLVTFMPQQVVLMLLSFVLYNNAHSADVTPDAKVMYVHAMFAGVFNIATIPMMTLFICCVNSWTTSKMLYFMYNTSMLLAVVQLAYHCVYIDSSQVSPNPAAKIRMRQALYLMLTSVLACLTVIPLVYMPMHDNGMNRFLAIAYIVVLWVLHILFDATKGNFDSYLYERSFNIFDGVLATIRYMLLIFVFYLVWGIEMNDSIIR